MLYKQLTITALACISRTLDEVSRIEDRREYRLSLILTYEKAMGSIETISILFSPSVKGVNVTTLAG